MSTLVLVIIKMEQVYCCSALVTCAGSVALLVRSWWQNNEPCGTVARFWKRRCRIEAFKAKHVWQASAIRICQSSVLLLLCRPQQLHQSCFVHPTLLGRSALLAALAGSAVGICRLR